jgi:hypothetical protein
VRVEKVDGRAGRVPVVGGEPAGGVGPGGGGLVGGGRGLGVLAQQVVEGVAARLALDQQVRVEQVLQEVLGLAGGDPG